MWCIPGLLSKLWAALGKLGRGCQGGLVILGMIYSFIPGSLLINVRWGKSLPFVSACSVSDTPRGVFVHSLLILTATLMCPVPVFLSPPLWLPHRPPRSLRWISAPPQMVSLLQLFTGPSPSELILRTSGRLMGLKRSVNDLLCVTIPATALQWLHHTQDETLVPRPRPTRLPPSGFCYTWELTYPLSRARAHAPDLPPACFLSLQATRLAPPQGLWTSAPSCLERSPWILTLGLAACDSCLPGSGQLPWPARLWQQPLLTAL